MREKSDSSTRERLVNWLALLALLSLGIVWPPVFSNTAAGADDAPRLTLVTCYPFDAIQPGGPLRFVVTANLIAGAGISPPQRVARAAAPPDSL
jgi:hypothetical protein